MDMLAKAVELAGLHHAGQVDKARRPYILHPLSVMHKVQAMTNSLANTETLAAAVMHDLIEDTAVTADLLLQLGFPFNVVELVQVLSRDKANESYQEFIDRVAGHSFAAAVIKMADIQDNIDVLRLDPQAMFDKDLQRLVKYRGAYAQLEAHVGSIWKV